MIAIPPNFYFYEFPNHFLVLLFVQVHLVDLLVLGIEESVSNNEFFFVTEEGAFPVT